MSSGTAYPLSGPIESLGLSASFTRDAEIYEENNPAEYLYKVVDGTVRTYKALTDGRRQIGAFYMTGDFFGLEDEVRAFSAEAVTDANLVAIKRSTVMALAAEENDVARQLWVLTSRELERTRNHIQLMVESAEQRLAAFLIEMADRLDRGDDIELPMGRRDVADYLGLTVETVSRTFTHLEKMALIALPTSRRIVLRNRPALEQLAAVARLGCQ
jgi:CRP/FNR family transcriptional regulator, nitrogen fixation regulation protein